MKPNWMQQMEEDLGENRELGIGELLDALGRAIKEVGFDEVYDHLLAGEPPQGCDEQHESDFDSARSWRSRSPRLVEKGICPLGSRYSPGGNGHINIIPGDQKVACTPLALTLVNSRDQLHRFRVDWDYEDDRAVQWRRWVFTSMKAHLINCAGTVRAMVVVLDHWDAREFEREHAAELAAWRQRGVRFYFQLVTRRQSLSPVWVNLK
jgi:hypothetical protein